MYCNHDYKGGLNILQKILQILNLKEQSHQKNKDSEIAHQDNPSRH